MIHKYRKTALIEAEQFDGSIEMTRKYNIERGEQALAMNITYQLMKEIWLLTKAIILLLAWMASIGALLRTYLNELTRGWISETYL